MSYPAIYTIKIWNELSENTEVVHGVTFGDSYVDAIKNIEDYYGSDIVSIEYMEQLEGPQSVVEISENEFENILKG